MTDPNLDPERDSPVEEAPPAPGAGFAAKLKRLGSESLIYGLSSIVGRFLTYLLQPYYAHYFSTAENGVQSAVYTYIPIISLAFYLGMDVAYMRNAAATEDDPEERKRVFTMSFGMILVVGGALTLLGFLSAAWLAPVFRLGRMPFRYMLALVYTDALLAVPYAHLRMTSRSLRYAVYRLLFVGITLVLNIWLISSRHWGVEAIFLSNLVASVVVLAIFLLEIAKLFRPALLPGAPWKALWKYALPIMPAMLAVMLVENGDRLVLAQLPEAAARAVYRMSSKDVLGIYNFNYKLGVVMLLVVQMFRMAWTPFSLQHARDPQAPQLYSRVLTALMLACSVVFLGVSVFLPPLVAIPAVYHVVSEPSYWLGLPIVPVILLGYIFSGMYAVVTAGLYIEKKTHVLPWIAGAGAVINLAICAAAAARWGMLAVAWATPVSYALMAAVGAWQSNRVYPVPFEWGRLLHLGALTAALFVADRWLTGGMAQLAPPTLAIKTALLLAFPLALALTGFFRAGEWRALRRLVRA